jgi:DnaB-like helicase C terminal domain
VKPRLRSWERRLLIVYRPLWTIDELVAHAQEVTSRRKLGGILIDYLQRIPPPTGKPDQRDLEVSLIGRRLRALAVDVAAPVVVMAQTTREVGREAARLSWHHASLRIHHVLTNAHFDQLSVPRLAPSPQRLEPPDADPHVRCPNSVSHPVSLPSSRSSISRNPTPSASRVRCLSSSKPMRRATLIVVLALGLLVATLAAET